ncbi:restriction endonuclease subunit S [Pseudomonas sp. PLB05]|uniref:restriction endonuclease subunit S n=1 Tax=Pseudomonas sp. PLB05 TaxID=2899078 RepID=UPI001E2D0BD0|nr:restriction endonuclease subunit S [Pseudomonas sp. PLB05]MCD4864886.1 restriction endonuclease subunit S [Pseudomonas sp. PLB05]
MTNLSGTNLNNGAAVGPQCEGRESPSRFPKYPEYKDSGVEWLGVVPEHWGGSPLKWIAEQVTDKATTSEFQVGLENIEGWTGRFIETDMEFAGDGIAFRQEDILFGKLRPYLAKVWLADRPGQAVGDFFVLRPRAVNSEFLHKYILTPSVIEDLNASTIGAKMPRVGWEDMAALAVTLPPHKEQIQIACFLDHETARIDALIEEQQRLIELLKEKRQAVISHAVTKGLDTTVPMKDSGVEWLGEVPAHWVVSKFGYISSVVRGGSPRPAGDPELFNGDYSPWVTVAEITKDDEIYLNETEAFLTKKGSDQCRIFSKGTLLLSNSGATLGVPKILMINANANDGVVGFENLSLDKEYSYLYLATLTEGLRDRAAGSGQPNLNTDIVKSIDVPIPPSNEVAEIVAAVKKLRAQFNFLSKEAVEGIRLLQERRSALISAAVTGKIDVRGWQPPASAPTPELVQEAV